MNHLLNKLKNLLVEIWEDFKDPASARVEHKACCSSGPFHREDQLILERIRIIQQDNKKINLKNKQS